MAYATETNRDFDLKFMKNPISNDVVMKIDRPDRVRFPAIEQSITNIVMTSKLERRFVPAFGGNVLKTLFELITDFDQISVPGEINIKEVIKMSLKKYEPRITVENVDFGDWKEDSNSNKLNITIMYSVPPVNEVLSYTLGIKRVR
jgi:phage baseplate assembly protein W